MNESLGQEQTLINGLLSFVIELGEVRLGIQVAQERTHLFHSGFAAKFASHLAEVTEVDQEGFVQRPVADTGMADDQVELPHLPVRELPPEPQKAMDTVELHGTYILNDLLIRVTGHIKVPDGHVAGGVDECQVEQ